MGLMEIEPCATKGCENEATKITATATSYVVLCDDCYHDKYKS